MDEFALIRRYFDRAIQVTGVATGIGDDGAVLQPAPGKELVHSLVCSLIFELGKQLIETVNLLRRFD